MSTHTRSLVAGADLIKDGRVGWWLRRVNWTGRTVHRGVEGRDVSSREDGRQLASSLAASIGVCRTSRPSETSSHVKQML